MDAFGVSNIPVRNGNVDFNFVAHPPAPEPSIRSQLVNLGSTGTLGKTGKVSKGKLAFTVIGGVAAGYSAYVAPKKIRNRRLLETLAVIAVGGFWTMS